MAETQLPPSISLPPFLSLSLPLSLSRSAGKIYGEL